MFAAGIFVAAAFFIFVVFALLLLAPGMLLYSAGIRTMFSKRSAEFYNSDGMKVIDVTEQSSDQSVVAKGRGIMKSAATKVRNFLNRYVD